MTPADFTRSCSTFIDAMFETMYAAPGIGLAATQVDFHKRLLVIDVSKDRGGAARLHQPRDPDEGRGGHARRGLPVGAGRVR